MQRATRSRRWWLWICVWVALMAAGAMVDAPVARQVEERGISRFVRSSYFLTHVVKRPGEFGVTCIVAAIVCVVHRWRWRAGVFVAVSNVAGLINTVVKWGVGRTRPFKLPAPFAQPAPFHFDPFRGGLRGVMRQTDLAFASGHGVVAFATAAALALLWPRWKWVFFAVAVGVGLERVAENAHYVTDVIAAAALAVGGGHLIWE